MHFRWKATAALVVVVMASACADVHTPSEPGAAEARASSIEVTSLAITDSVGPVGLRLTANVRPSDEGPNGGDIDDLRYETLHANEMNELGTALQRFEWDDRSPGVPGLAVSPSASIGISQQLFKSTTVSSTDDQGNVIRMVTIRANITGGRGGLPGASLLFRNDTLQAVMEVIREPNAPDVSGLRVIRFGADRKPNAVTEIRSSGAKPTAAGATPEGFFSRLAASCGGVIRLLGPEPLHAQEEECMDYEMDMAFALSAYWGAEGAMLLACLVGGPLSPACGIAIAALSVAAAYLTWTTTQYQDCLLGYDPDPGQGGSFMYRFGDDSHPTEEECYYIEWEISHDGGATWHFYGVQIVC